jgi:hypothetical protein
MDAIYNIRDVWFAIRRCRMRNVDWESRFGEVDSGHTHGTEDRVVLSEQAGEAPIAAEGRVYLLCGAVDGVTSMKHCRLEVTPFPLVHCVPDRLTDFHVLLPTFGRLMRRLVRADVQSVPKLGPQPIKNRSTLSRST